MLCVAKVLLHAAKVLLYAAKVLLCNAKVLLYLAGVAPRKTRSNLSSFFIFSNVTDRFRQHHLTVRPSHPKSFLDRNPFLPGILSYPESLFTRSPFLSGILSFPKDPLARNPSLFHSSVLLFFCPFLLPSFRSFLLLFFSPSVLFSFCSFVLLSLPPFQIHNWYTTITPVVRFAHTHV